MKVRLAWRNVGLESIPGRIELENSPKKEWTVQCTCRNIWKRKEMSSDVAVSLTADSQIYAAPNWLSMRWCRGTTDCGLGIAGATELQMSTLQLSLLGHELALRV